MSNIQTLSQRASRWQVAAICLALAAITFAVFGQTLHHEFVSFDDSLYVYENATVTSGLSMHGLVWVFTHADCFLYHPLTMLSLMADDQLYGLHAGGYHFTNVLLHTASVILLFLILRQMTGALWRSAFVAAVFAVHPLRAESVAWVAERKDVLSAFFFMLTLGAYVHYVRNPKSLTRYLMVAAAFVLALLSKPTVVTLPFVLLLLDCWPLQRTESLRRLILEKIPLLALAAGACVMTVLAAGKEVAADAYTSMPSRIGNALVSYAVYLRQIVWPEGLAPFYPRPEKGYPVWTITLSFLVLALITGGVLAIRRKRPWLLTGWLWYLGMLTPMIGLVQVGEFAHADRMTYLPQIGICLALTWLVAEWRVNQVALELLMTGVLAVLMVSTRKQTAYWKNSETLWNRALASTTGNYVAHYGLGVAFLRQGRTDESISQYQMAVAIKPDYAEAYNNLGEALDRTGNVDEAITQFQKAVEIQPDYATAHYNLGIALREKGRVDEAIAHFKQALQIDPNYAAAHGNLGIALLNSGRVDEAIAHFKEVLRINPGRAQAHNNLGNAFLQKGNVEEAITQYRDALQINPADARVKNNLAWLLATCPQASLRDGNMALELATQANTATGAEDPVILHTLAAAFAEAGRFSEAVEIAQLALRVAEVQSNTVLAAQLQSELKLYKTGSPYHSPVLAH